MSDKIPSTIHLDDHAREALLSIEGGKKLYDYSEVDTQELLSLLEDKSPIVRRKYMKALQIQEDSALGRELLKQELAKTAIQPSENQKGNEISQEELPLAPTTAFNVMRLVQLGYFPKDYAAMWGEKPGKFHKGVQMFYVLPGRLGEWSRTKANTAFQKKYDRDSAYKDFMLDLTKQMNAELDDWFRQNKLSNKANIDDARRTLDDMQRSFASGNEKEAFAHFDTLAEKMGMRVNGRWHERPLTDLDQLRQEQDASTDARDARVERARAQKTTREGQLQQTKSELKAKRTAIDDFYARNSGANINSQFQADDIKVSDIDAEIKKLELEKVALANHAGALRLASNDVQSAVASRDFAKVQSDRDTIGYSHTNQADTFIPASSTLARVQGEIESRNGEVSRLNGERGAIKIAENTLSEANDRVDTLQKRITTIEGLIASKNTTDATRVQLQAELVGINGDPHANPPTIGTLAEAKDDKRAAKNELDAKRAELDAKRAELESLDRQKRSLTLESQQNKTAFDWYSNRETRISQIDDQMRAYADLKPLIEARNKSIRALHKIQTAIRKSPGFIANQEQRARDAHATASPIHEALDRLTAPGLSQSEKLEMNTRLNELLAQNNPEAQRIEQLLKGNQAQKNQAMRELRQILDYHGKGVDFFKTSLDSIESKIKGLQSEASRVMTEYDKQAGTGDVEVLRKKMEGEIGKINAEIERYNADARTKYGAAAAVLTPVEMNSLHLQTKLGAFFGALNKGTTKIESLSSTRVGGKAMRGVYGAMTLAGLGQIGVTTANSGWKQGALDLADMGVGFIPVVGGAYDIVVGATQIFTGEEIIGERKVSKTDAWKRVGFGVLGLFPIIGQGVKAMTKGEKIVRVARQVAVAERAANIATKGLILNEAHNLGVALYDAGGSIVAENGGVAKTAESLYQGTRLPINQ